MCEYSNCLVEQCVTLLWCHLFDERQCDIALVSLLRRRKILFRPHLTPYRGAVLPACLAPDGRQGEQSVALN